MNELEAARENLRQRAEDCVRRASALQDEAEAMLLAGDRRGARAALKESAECLADAMMGQKGAAA